MSEPINVEFGANGRTLDGWQCHDIEVPIQKPLPYETGSVTMVMASHVCEHVTTHECFGFFREVHRILKPGGRFRVIVPTLDNIEDREHAISLILGHGHLQLFSKKSLVHMLWAAGFEKTEIRNVRKDPVLDVHDAQIGVEKDELESARYEATK